MSRYADIFDRAAKETAAWRQPHVVSILTRTCMVRLYSECLDAATQGRERGLAIDLVEVAGSDAIRLSFRGRGASFTRGSDALHLTFDGLPIGQTSRVLALPASVALADDWASAHVHEVLTVLGMTAPT